MHKKITFSFFHNIIHMWNNNGFKRPFYIEKYPSVIIF